MYLNQCQDKVNCADKNEDKLLSQVARQCRYTTDSWNKKEWQPSLLAIVIHLQIFKARTD
jgi:hypothetical protein